MTSEQYRTALHILGLLPSSRATAKLLGVSVRQAHKYDAGKAPIPQPVALLLEAYLRHGLPAFSESPP